MLPFLMLWQIIFPKIVITISPIPSGLLQCDLVLHLSPEVESFSSSLRLGRSSDCFDQDNLVEVIGSPGMALNWSCSIRFLSLSNQLPHKKYVYSKTPPCSEKPRPHGEALEDELLHGQKSQGAVIHQTQD